jgi:radical SAM superfamily enzyme YgiQ (UPF0313 family)
MIPLINLPSPFLTDEKTLMPLGLLYIGASIEYHGKKCVIIDLANRKDYVEYTIKELEKYKNEFTSVGISITTSQAPIARELSKEIHDHFPGVRIIAGGPHVTHCFQASKRQPERTKKIVDDLYNNYDVLVIGDGEKAIFAALEPNSPKVIDASLKISSYYVDSAFLDELPYPARHLIDIHSYHYNLGHSSIEETNAINIMSQRGCPYSCRFCASRMDKFGRVIRKTGVTKVINEIEYLYNTYGYTDYTFYDDELNVDPNLGSLLNNLKDLQMNVGKAFRFRCFVKANLVTKNQMKELADAGFKVIATGAESGSERILTNMLKKATIQDNTNVVEWAREYGIYTKSIMSLGHPGESPETLQETEKWLDEVKLDDVNFTIISALPSSAYYDNSVLQNGVWVYTSPETGDKLYDVGIDWTKIVHFYNADPSLTYESTVYTDYLSRKELVRWHSYFEKKYKNSKNNPH